MEKLVTLVLFGIVFISVIGAIYCLYKMYGINKKLGAYKKDNEKADK